jgi:hypothetical protein
MNHSPIESTVAFFVALTDDEVDKNWEDLGKAAIVVAPALFAFVATKGRSKKASVRSLIAPAVAMGKIIHDVNQQVTPAHRAQAHLFIEQTKSQAAHLKEQVAERVRQRTSSL